MAKARKTAAGRRIVVALSDTHCGHRLGLCNPATVLEDVDAKGNRYSCPVRLTETQTYLWEKYQSDMATVKALAGGDEIIVLVAGDLTQGIKHPQSLMAMTCSTRSRSRVMCCGPGWRMDTTRG